MVPIIVQSLSIANLRQFPPGLVSYWQKIREMRNCFGDAHNALDSQIGFGMVKPRMPDKADQTYMRQRNGFSDRSKITWAVATIPVIVYTLTMTNVSGRISN